MRTRMRGSMRPTQEWLFVLVPAKPGIDMRKEMGKIPPYSLAKGMEYDRNMEVAKNIEMKQPFV